MTDDTRSSKSGGIAWAGSLVGSQNPDAPTGYRYSNPTKRYRIDEDGRGGSSSYDLPENIQVILEGRDGTATEILDIPTSSSVEDLTKLLQALKEDTAKTPYSFYIGVKEPADTEIQTTLAELLLKHRLSTERTLSIVYQPLAVFRVRPVSRNTDTLHGHTDSVLHVSYAPNHTFVASGGGDKLVRFWDVHTHTTKFQYEHKDHVLCTSWSPDGRRFASGDKRGNLIVYHLTTQSQKAIKAHASFMTDICWQPLHIITCVNDDDDEEGAENLVTASKDGTVKLWNGRTGRHLHTFAGHTDSVERVAWGEFLYSASRDRTIKVWNVQRHILVKTLSGHGHRINTLAVSTQHLTRLGSFDYKTTKEGSSRHVAKQKYDDFRKQHGEDRLVSGSDDYTIIFWKPESSKKPIKRLTGHQNLINDVQFSPDSRYFCSAAFDKKIKLWNGFTGDFIMTFTGHVGPVYKIAWSPDSRYIVSASADSTAKLWELNQKAPRETLPGHFDEVYALDWSLVSGSVATGSKDRTIKIWNH